MNKIIEIKALSKSYHIKSNYYDTLRKYLSNLFILNKKETIVTALSNINISIDEGEKIGIIGLNGSGKSTLLKIISGITPPSLGQVIVYGHVGSMLEVGTGFHPELTGRENIYMNAALLGFDKKYVDSKIQEIFDFADAEKFIDIPVKKYSSGMILRIALSVILVLNPEILVIDEILAVGDFLFKEKSVDKIKANLTNPKTLLIVSHNMDQIKNLCDRVIVLNKGIIIYDGEVDEGIRQYVGIAGSTTKTFGQDCALKFIKAFENKNGLLELYAEYNFKQIPLIPNLGFVVSDEFGNPLFGTNADVLNKDVNLNYNSSGAISIVVQQPTLKAGNYYISVWFGDGITNFFEEMNCLKISINQKNISDKLVKGTGPINIICDYNFIPVGHTTTH